MNHPNTTQAARAATGTVTCPIGTEQQNGTEHTIIGCGSTEGCDPVLLFTGMYHGRNQPS